MVAKEILNVPLAEDVVVNRLVWNEENNGEYSVCTGYGPLRNLHGYHSNCKVVGNWRNLWNIMAPPRVKHLLWRICRGLSSIIKPRLQAFSDAKSLILDICSREDRKNTSRFSMMVEVIWKNRNNIVWNNEREGLSRLGLQTYFNWQDWFAAQDNHERINGNQISLVGSPPVEGLVKCNVDAGFNRPHRSTNRGLCFRDNMGRFITAGVAWDIGSMSSREADALALKEAVQHAVILNLDHVIFESDSQVIN
ncbi:uncharacterized protein LOC131614614 [Vicia villosa]|uniref:uncharacterized protein LOC131614614 n=1 Tax=Vicia villosa TaxID=3911 RepID=UPI00273C2C2F|nr:uncharacterized protein LOC131614614 [Vicia villosa]